MIVKLVVTPEAPLGNVCKVDSCKLGLDSCLAGKIVAIINPFSAVGVVADPLLTAKQKNSFVPSAYV